MAAPLPDLAPGGRPATREPGAVEPPGPAAVVESVVVLAAVVVLVGPVAHNEGGRGPGAAALLAALTVGALLCTRAWRRLSARWWLLAPAVALAAFYVLPATGGGRAAAVAQTSYAIAAGLALAVAAYARTPARRAAVAGVLVAGGVAQFAWALVPWWGGQIPSRPMVGTYYWHNQLAVALLLPALLGAALAVAGRRPWRAAGWVAAPLCAAGVVLSTSRATTACLVAGWLAVLAVSTVTSGNRRSALVRAVVVTVAAAAVTVALPGPPLFDTRVSPLSGASARAASGETVDANTTYRTQFWREAGSVTARYPLTGAGYGRLAQASTPITPSTWAHSPLAHSAVLQAFADGGLPLGGTVLAAVVVLGVALVRRLWTGVRAASRPASGGPAFADPAARADAAVSAAAAVAALALLAHCMVDIDWTYPALAAQFAVVVGLALATGPVQVRARPVPGQGDGHLLPAARSGRHTELVASVAVAVVAVVLVAGGGAAWGQSFHVFAPQTVIGKVHQ